MGKSDQLGFKKYRPYNAYGKKRAKAFNSTSALLLLTIIRGGSGISAAQRQGKRGFSTNPELASC